MAIKRRAEAYWVDARQRWQINVQRDGIRRCFTAYTAGKKGKHECEAKADKWLENFNSDQKMENAFELYLKEKQETTTPATFANVSARMRKIKEILPRKKMLSAYTVNDWQKTIDELVKDGLSVETVKAHKAQMLNFLSFCLRNKWEFDKIEPEQIVIRQGAKAPKEKEAYSLEEIRILMSPDLNSMWHINFFRLLLFTGFRKNELCAIMWEDIDFFNKVINVKRGVDAFNNTTLGKTGNVIRKVALSSHAERILLDQKARQKEAGLISKYIFSEKNGEHIAYRKINSEFDKLKAKGIEHTIHELRHTFVSLTDKELSLALLKKSIGHSAAMTTQKTYSHTTQADIDKMRSGVDRAFDEII